MEHIIHSSVLAHLENVNILSDDQHGFRKRRSCETQLVLTIHDLAKALDSGAVALCGFKASQEFQDTIVVGYNRESGSFRPKSCSLHESFRPYSRLPWVASPSFINSALKNEIWKIMPFPCVVCDQEVQPRHHALECESCFQW
jgi:hypothetical protein